MDPVVLPRSEHGLSRKLIDPEARKVLYRLHNHGYLAYLVGGSVRDILLGREPKDFDIATNAHPSEVRRLFRNSRTIGRRFRLVHVFFRDGTIIEVSTFRKTPDEPIENEADPATEESDASFAENNTFGTPEEDATRRDFTINALFYDISSFSILDYTGGLADLDRGIIRTIGDPYVRFVEDPVRILRALDYSARLGFTLEPSTEKAIQQLMPEILRGAPSRLTEEILEVFRYGFSEPTVRLFYRYDVFHYLLPSVQKALLHENDAWMKSLIKLDSLVQSSRIKPSDTLIFSLLFMPVLVNRTQPLTPSSAMQIGRASCRERV